MPEKEESNLFFNGLMFGGVIGGVLGLLFAPWRGEETRDKIKKKIEDLNLDPDKALEEFKDKGEQVLEGAKESLLGAIERISLAVEEGKKRAKEEAEDLEREDSSTRPE